MVARALCCSSVASWSRCTRLLSSGVVRLLVKLAFLRCRVAFAAWVSRPLCEFRTYISQPARSRELQRCFIVKLCPPLRKMVSTSRAKMYQAPRVFYAFIRLNYCANAHSARTTRLLGLENVAVAMVFVELQ